MTTCRIVCPDCRGTGRAPDGEPCASCRGQAHLEAGEAGYDAAVRTWADRGVDPAPAAD